MHLHASSLIRHFIAALIVGLLMLWLGACRYIGPFSRDFGNQPSDIDPQKVSEGEKNVRFLGGPYPRESKP